MTGLEYVAAVSLPLLGGLYHFANQYGYGRLDWVDARKQACNVAIILTVVSIAWFMMRVGRSPHDFLPTW